MLQAVPDDLRTKLSIDEDLGSSPNEALSRASLKRVTMRNKNIRRCTASLPAEIHDLGFNLSLFRRLKLTLVT